MDIRYTNIPRYIPFYIYIDIPKISPISRGNRQVWALETTDQAKDLETLLARATR